MMGNISGAELEVMEILWAQTDWVDIHAVHSALSARREWAYTTVATFMLRLTEKGFLKCEKRGRTKFYRPAINREEYQRMETEDFLHNVYRGSKKNLIAALYQDELSEDELDELLRWIDER